MGRKTKENRQQLNLFFISLTFILICLSEIFTLHLQPLVYIFTSWHNNNSASVSGCFRITCRPSLHQQTYLNFQGYDSISWLHDCVIKDFFLCLGDASWSLWLYNSTIKYQIKSCIMRQDQTLYTAYINTWHTWFNTLTDNVCVSESVCVFGSPATTQIPKQAALE